VKVLLPTSEGKRSGGDGPALRDLPKGPLTKSRLQVAAALRRFIRSDPDAAAGALLLPPAVRDAALAADKVAATSPTMPALDRYDGVLYQALDGPSLTPARRGNVLIFSGLLGVVAGDEPVPDYRVPAAAVLPGFGGIGRWWRPAITKLLDPAVEGELLVDLRSTDYLPMWTPPGGATVVTVRVEAPSFNAKQAKGQLARALLTGRARSEEDVGAAAESLGFRVQYRMSPRMFLLSRMS
jgi:cytoplasmic iron level regulating protein YaaA (DUF328/UPF0246 family)